MPVSDIMTTDLITITPAHTVGDMYSIFKSKPLHHLLVIEGGKLIGIVTDREVLKVLSPFINSKHEASRDQLTLSYTARQLMKKQPATIKPNASVRAAAQSILDNNVFLLPVVDNDEKLIGVLSWKDVLRYIIE